MAAGWLDAPADRVGRVLVEPDLTVPGMPEIFVIGDTAHVFVDGKPVPGVAPAAKQQGAYVASVIRAQNTGVNLCRVPSSIATSGIWRPSGAARQRSTSGVSSSPAGSPGGSWGIAHIYFLIGTRSRLTVAISWALVLSEWPEQCPG